MTVADSIYDKAERKFRNDPTPGFSVPLTAAANRVLAGPTTGAAATPSFRALVPADFPAATTSARGIVKLAGQLGGTADLPDVRGIRETSGPTLLTIGSVPDGYMLKRSGSTVIGVSVASVTGIQQATGFDTSALSGVVAHWPILSSVNGGTDVPDVVGTHTGTATATIAVAGSPFCSADGNALINQQVGLADSTNLRLELRDASCAFMAWVALEHPGSAVVLFQALAAGETEAANCLFQASVSSSGEMLWLSEHGAGVNDAVTGPLLAPGTRCLLWQREHSSGAGTSTITFGIDGVFVQQTTGVTNPTGGTTAAGTLTITGANSVYLGECLLTSGALMTEAQFLAQYQRGHGIY